MSGFPTQLVMLAGPLGAVVVLRLVKWRSLGRPAHYGLFAGAGILHGYLMWLAFLASEWRPDRTLEDLLHTLPRGGLRMSLFFGLVYLLVALIVDLSLSLRLRRRSRPANPGDGQGS